MTVAPLETSMIARGRVVIPVLGPHRGSLRAVRRVLRVGTVLAAIVLLTGCLNSSTGRPGSTSSDTSEQGDGVTGLDGSPGGGGSGGESVTGSGRLTSRLIDVSGVTSVAVGAGFVVQVTVGEPEQATVRMDDNLTDLIEATVSGGRLRLGIKPGASVRNATLTADVTVRRLDRLATGGVSQVTLASAPTGPALALVVGGASRVTGPVAVDRVEATVSGTSRVGLSGQVSDLHLSAAGSSQLALADLAVRNLEVVLSGASEATVTVSGTLAAQTSGVAKLRYRGNPNITRQQTSGVSSIRRAG